MANRPTFKQQNSFVGGSEGPAYEMKPIGSAVFEEILEEPGSDTEGLETEKKGTRGDQKDMHRMNKYRKVQELRRNFRFLSIFGYSLILGNAWVLALTAAIIPLQNGGSGGAIWGTIIVCIGMSFSMLSMAEMASMAPTAGGQYHWVSEFAARAWQKPLSYAVLGWQTALCSSSFTAALGIQGIIAINNETYTLPAWHAVLLTIGIVVFSILFNTVLIRKLLFFEGIMLILHIFVFFAVSVVLWVMGDRAPSEQTFFEFTDWSGWGSVGIATMIGSGVAATATLGSDSAAHLAEELQDASWVLPRSMAVTAIVNYSLCLLMTITYMSVKGDTVDALLGSSYGQPYIQIFMNATQSKAGTNALTALVTILMIFGVINQVTTTSRQLFAFARDGGLPFSSFLCRVKPGWDIPLNAVTVTIAFSVLISMIILGSPTAFYNIGALCGVGLFSSYIICIACIAWRRIRGLPLLPCRFSLGRAGLTGSLLALAFLMVEWFFMFWPSYPNPNAAGMNWTVLIYWGVIAWSFVYYWVRGKKQYSGPVEYVRKSI
ncbi:hypothetical protein LTR37_017108 [Vermiconidia calcicola]|uniref:Uncharacterized protein n=1 Tax=Vermiconidia calcicola TaxID=1690605 RepID=A0ACC3MLL2_9PEZI|nr:hypothetical protein LTR37_017108 [Vermiconidia calcicola]